MFGLQVQRPLLFSAAGPEVLTRKAAHRRRAGAEASPAGRLEGPRTLSSRVTPAVKLNINRVKRVLRGICGKQGPLGNGSERLNKGMYATTAARLMTNSDVRGTQPRVARRGSQPRLRGGRGRQYHGPREEHRMPGGPSEFANASRL